MWIPVISGIVRMPLFQPTESQPNPEFPRDNERDITQYALQPNPEVPMRKAPAGETPVGALL
jgi:hypothetical protein